MTGERRKESLEKDIGYLHQSLFIIFLVLSDVHAQCPSIRKTSIPHVIGNEQLPSESQIQNILDTFPAQSSSLPGQGSCTFSVRQGVQNVQSSNYIPGSFVLQNTGSKNISGFLFVVHGAVVLDAVFDPTGDSGDNVAKKFMADTLSGGVKVKNYPSSNDRAYMEFPGNNPLPETPGRPGARGGYRGLALPFDAFPPGGILRFSCDMDPNCIAKFTKAEADVAFNKWDTGGVSGAEIIGSRFYCKFKDGRVASAYLGSDLSQAGSQGYAIEGAGEQTVTITVYTGDGAFQSGSTVGTWGGEKPAVRVKGPANANVRVSLVKCIQPMQHVPLRDVAEQRLARAQPAFPCNNYYSIATKSINLKEKGNRCIRNFDYSLPPSSYDGETYLAIIASVVDSKGNPRGPIAKVYLHNNGFPVLSSCSAMTCSSVLPSSIVPAVHKPSPSILSIPPSVTTLSRTSGGLVACPSKYPARQFPKCAQMPDGRLVLYSNSVKPFNIAEADCLKLNLQLVRILSEEENEIIRQLVTDEPCPTFLKCLTWIGVDDRDREGTFVYTGTSQSLQYAKWHPGEPNDNNAGEDCGVFLSGVKKWIKAADVGKWGDQVCSQKARYVCSEPVEVGGGSPIPSSATKSPVVPLSSGSGGFNPTFFPTSSPVTINKSKNPCHAEKGAQGVSCDSIVLPVGLCSACAFREAGFYGKLGMLPRSLCADGDKACLNGDLTCTEARDRLINITRPRDVDRLGNFYNCRNIFTINSECASKLREYIDLNPCDTKRKSYMDILDDPNSGSDARYNAIQSLDYFVYSIWS